MKSKFKLALIGLLLVMGCQKRELSQQSQCVDCRPAESTTASFLIDQTLVEGKKYSSNENDRYFYSIQMSELETRAAVQRLIGLNPDALNISAVVFFLPTKKNISQLKLDQILGYMVYKKHWSGKHYEVSAYKLSNGSFEPSAVNALKSKFVSSNDFRRTAALLYGDENVNTTISFIDFVGLLNTNPKDSEFQRFLKSQSSIANFRISAPSCESPCTAGSGNLNCTPQPDGEWTCNPVVVGNDGPCFMTECVGLEPVDPTLGPVRDRYNVVSLFDNIYSFRDNYLDIYSDSLNYSGWYYYLSSKVQWSNLSWSAVDDLFQLLDLIDPYLQMLENDPWSTTSVPIPTDVRNQIVDFLTTYRYALFGPDEQDDIDLILAKVDFFHNQSSNFITSNL